MLQFSPGFFFWVLRWPWRISSGVGYFSSLTSPACSLCISLHFHSDKPLSICNMVQWDIYIYMYIYRERERERQRRRDRERGEGLPGGSAIEFTFNVAATGVVNLTPRLERSPGGGQGNPLQYSCLGNPMHRGAWWATVHRIAKSRT